MTTKHAEQLLTTPEFELHRSGRFLIAELLEPHLVLSTSFCNGGQVTHIRFLLNHQSCEGTDHGERHTAMMQNGLDGYHDQICADLGLNPQLVASMGTAANMNYAVIKQASDGPVTATAVVTAGVQGNAACAGDPAAWRETEQGWEKVSPLSGTINTLLFLNHSVSEGALARTVMTITEAKTAALHQLGVRSLYSKAFATGTGTDQYGIAAPLAKGKALTSASPHVKLGELIGVVVRDATLEALRWQNGLEPSTTRNLFHALGCYGLVEAKFLSDIAPWLAERELDLLKKNLKSVVYEPRVAAAAFAMAAVLDRIRYGTLPVSVARDVFRQYAATLATSLAAKPEAWPRFFASLPEADPEHPAPTILSAIALGWADKWH